MFPGVPTLVLSPCLIPAFFVTNLYLQQHLEASEHLLLGLPSSFLLRCACVVDSFFQQIFSAESEPTTISGSADTGLGEKGTATKTTAAATTTKIPPLIELKF